MQCSEFSSKNNAVYIYSRNPFVFHRAGRLIYMVNEELNEEEIQAKVYAAREEFFFESDFKPSTSALVLKNNASTLAVKHSCGNTKLAIIIFDRLCIDINASDFWEEYHAIRAGHFTLE